MTQDQDIERVLDRWFTEGPTQMPNRFLDDTLDRIDRVPPRRLPALGWTLPVLNPYLRFAAAAVIVAGAGFGAVVLTQSSGIGSGSPQGSVLLPPSLQAEWHPVGTRDLPGRSGPIAQGLDIVIAPTRVTVFDYHVDVLNSAQLVGPDRIEVRALNMGKYWHCQVGDAGTYAFRLSAGDKQLTLSPVSDSCAERATILAGDWTRTDIGNLVPGRRVSALFRPLGGGTSGQFAYSAPSGWAVRSEGDERETWLTLSRVEAAEGPAINLFSSVALAAQSPACAEARPASGATSLAVAQWLTTFRDLVVTTPTAVKIGGLGGVRVDLSERAGSTNQCNAFNSEGTGSYVLTVAGERRARYYLLDAGQGRILLVDVEVPHAATWDATLADAMPIVDSFEFAR